MSFSSFFSKQARKPTGLFGRFIMSTIFDKGNEDLNSFVYELMSVQPDDQILEIGYGTGKLINKMVQQINSGCIVGVDFSDTMISIAKKKNRKNVDKGKVKLLGGNFDEMKFENEYFTKVCSVNTLYFWPNPEHTARKITNILKPKGKLVLAFEDIEQLEQRNLSSDIFHLYSKDAVQDLLIAAGFSSDIRVESKKRGDSVLHCVVAIK
ncbi:MAG: methyltransferase domain-containing protein [Ignavibacteriaceae bacterium]